MSKVAKYLTIKEAIYVLDINEQKLSLMVDSFDKSDNEYNAIKSKLDNNRKLQVSLKKDFEYELNNMIVKDQLDNVLSSVSKALLLNTSEKDMPYIKKKIDKFEELKLNAKCIADLELPLVEVNDLLFPIN